jgi:MFS family permease
LGSWTLRLLCWSAHRPEERTRVQSVNDFLVFGTMALGSFFSGGLLTSYGWDVVLWVSFAPLLVALAALVFLICATAHRIQPSKTHRQPGLDLTSGERP